MAEMISTRKSITGRVRPTIGHKFSIGAQVGRIEGGPAFHVTRQLPDGGQGLQYRIKSDHDGHERVVVESTLVSRV